MNSFLTDYSKLVCESANNSWNDNYDAERFGARNGSSKNHSPISRRAVKQLLTTAGLTTLKTSQHEANEIAACINNALQCYIPHLGHIEWLYERLNDEESRDILCKVLAFRAMGERKVKLPLSNPDYWRGIDAIEGLADKTDCIDLDFLHYKACKMNLDDIGYPIELYYSPKDLYTNYVLEQYKCKTPSHSIEVDSGDVVLDCGGCYGDTALYFAHKSSDKGSVYSFEFVPSNLEIWERNTKMNPKLAERIHLVKAPLWSESGQPLYIEGKGPASKVVAEPESKDALEVRTISIDDMVSEQNLSKVSFIKMDIEGAELQALKGAANTLRQYRPKLAICVYHDLEDFWTIPQYLEELDLGYRFYLRHFTIFQGETVLFAEA